MALTKPIIVIKAGRTEAAAKAAASHTGALTGSDEVLDAAFRRCGVLRVDRIAELFYMAEVLAKQPRPRGPRLTIVTNAGGPGVLATDALIAGGGELAALSPETIGGARTASCPPHWSHGNPIDILGDAGPDRYAKALEIAAADPNSDGLLVILTPQAMTDPTADRRAAQGATPGSRASRSWRAGWAGPTSRPARRSSTGPASRPSPTPTPPPAPSTYMWRYSYNLRGLYETPAPAGSSPTQDAPDRDRAEAIIQAVRAVGPDAPDRGRVEAAARRLRHPDRRRPASPATRRQAVAAADAIGYPVVLKLHSETITHKTDVGGVQLNLADADAVRARLSRRSRRRCASAPAPSTSWASPSSRWSSSTATS